MLQDFLNQFKSVVISSLDEENNPYSSYAPFIKNNGKYYIYISDIARHAKNLRTHLKASLIFIEDENISKNIFARKRASYQCKVKIISRNETTFSNILNLFSNKFDETMIKTLQGMNDFNLYELTPYSGEAVFGFGEAYTIGGEDMQTLETRKGGAHHKQK